MTARDVCLALAGLLMAAGPMCVPASVLAGAGAASGVAWMIGAWEIAGFLMAGAALAGREQRRNG